MIPHEDTTILKPGLNGRLLTCIDENFLEDRTMQIKSWLLSV